MGYDSFESLAERNLETDVPFEPTYSREEFKRRIERDGRIRGLETMWMCGDGSGITVRESAST